jgi:(S)-ureidoglycine aminohydrolase
VGANFAMYLATMGPNGTAAAPAPGVERFVFVLDGAVTAAAARHAPVDLHADQFAFFPAGLAHTLSTRDGAGLVIYERKYAVRRPAAPPRFIHGGVGAQPLVPAAGEVFALRKLLPQTGEYDFNVHVMDFLPGEHLNVKEVHYNQHGLLLLAGKGVYRLGDEWMPVQAGDAIWMAPYVVQWYAALGPAPSRYLLYKDTTVDPLEG